MANINKKISISIKFTDGMKIAKTGISFTELKHLIERMEVVCFTCGTHPMPYDSRAQTLGFAALTAGTQELVDFW